MPTHNAQTAAISEQFQFATTQDSFPTETVLMIVAGIDVCAQARQRQCTDIYQHMTPEYNVRWNGPNTKEGRDIAVICRAAIIAQHPKLAEIDVDGAQKIVTHYPEDSSSTFAMKYKQIDAWIEKERARLGLGTKITINSLPETEHDACCERPLIKRSCSRFLLGKLTA